MTNFKISVLFVVITSCLGACAETAPRTEAEFGNATRATLKAQIINPDAGKEANTVTGLDGRAARDAVDSYQRSFADPAPRPAPNNQFNIGIGNQQQ
jgi:type IV pilus biogenesis protein CpaD/CtpE